MTRAMNAAMGLAMGLVATLVSGQSSLGDRISRVEGGLAPELQIGASPTWTLKDRLAHHKVPGLSIAVINGGKVEWSKQYGVRDTKTGEPVGATTLFQVASITKPVTATVALKLVEKGVLDLDRDVNGHLKSWKVPENELTREQKVTLRRLLSHSAGLTVSGFRGYAAGEPVPSILQVLDGTPPANSAPIRVDKTPGSGFRYSGGGYTVLQLLIEDVTGRSLADLTEEMVLKPAGMTAQLHGRSAARGAGWAAVVGAPAGRDALPRALVPPRRLRVLRPVDDGGRPGGVRGRDRARAARRQHGHAHRGHGQGDDGTHQLGRTRVWAGGSSATGRPPISVTAAATRASPRS